MDAGNDTKGGARPKESGRRYRKNSRSKRALRSADSDSSDHLDARNRLKNNFENVSMSYSTKAGVDSFCGAPYKSKKERTRTSKFGYKSHDQRYPMIVLARENFMSSEHEFSDNCENLRLNEDKISEPKPRSHDINRSQLEHKNNSVKMSEHKRIERHPCHSSANSEEEQEETPISSDCQEIKRLTEVDGHISVGRSLYCTKPVKSGNERRRKKRRKYRHSEKPIAFSHDYVVPPPYDDHNSSSPQTILNGDVFSADSYINDIFGPQKGWNLSHNFKAQQFSSSSSEADDEFECDCNFCHNNAGTTGPMRIGLTRSVPSDRTEMSSQNYDGFLDDSILSQTESAWDIIVQELVEQIRRFNVDIDLFSPSVSMTNSDFESLPSMVPLRFGSHDSQEIQICTICLSNYESGEVAKILPCHHIFHMQCIKLWLAKLCKSQDAKAE